MTRDSVTDAAGRMLAKWAVREALLLEQVASNWPLHLQYAGDGELVAIAHADAELVWPLEEAAG